MENLFIEVLVRKHLQLSDPHVAFMVIGDIGTRVLMYYAYLERQSGVHHQSANPSEGRVVSWQDYGTCISSQFYGQPHYSLAEWKTTLSNLSQQLLQPDFVPTLLSNNVQRLSLAPSNNLTCSHYLF